MMRFWGRTSAAVAAGAFAAGLATFAWSQQTPATSTPPAAPKTPPATTPAPPAARAEEPPPPAAEVPNVVTPGPTPEAPPQEIAPAPPSASDGGSSPSKSSDGDGAAKTPPPIKRTLYNAAIIQAVDKVTAETLRFEVQVRQPVRYKGLIFTLHTCETSPQGTLPSAFAHLEIDSQPQPLPGRPANPARQVFKGWMVADAPGLHPLEHPVYDAWLIACKTPAGPTSAARR